MTQVIAKIKEKFAKWAVLKEEIHFEKEAPFFKEREIWWTSIGFNIGFEQRGKNDKFERPVLVIKKFNRNIFWGIPLTSKSKEGKYYYPLVVHGIHASAILSQIRLLDAKRMIRRIEIIDEGHFEEIQGKICALIKNDL